MDIKGVGINIPEVRGERELESEVWISKESESTISRSEEWDVGV